MPTTVDLPWRPIVTMWNFPKNHGSAGQLLQLPGQLLMLVRQKLTRF